jgi:hypothetical protein
MANGPESRFGQHRWPGRRAEAFYVEDGGKFRLDVEGGFKTLEEISGLTTALGKERERADKAWKIVAKFEGIDPAEARKALETVANLDEAKKKTVEELEASFEARTKPLKEKVATYEETIAKLNGDLDDAIVGGALSRSEWIAANVSDDPIKRLWTIDLLRKQFKREDGKMVGYSLTGEKIYGDDGQIAPVKRRSKGSSECIRSKTPCSRAPKAAVPGRNRDPVPPGRLPVPSRPCVKNTKRPSRVAIWRGPFR